MPTTWGGRPRKMAGESENRAHMICFFFDTTYFFTHPFHS